MAIPRVWASVLGRSRLPLLSLCADLALHAATQRTSGVCRPRLRNEPNWRRARRRPEGGRQADRGTSAVRLGEAVRPQEPVRGRNRVRRDTSFAERIQPALQAGSARGPFPGLSVGICAHLRNLWISSWSVAAFCETNPICQNTAFGKWIQAVSEAGSAGRPFPGFPVGIWANRRTLWISAWSVSTRLCPSSCRSAAGRIGGDQWRSVVHQPDCETNRIRPKPWPHAAIQHGHHDAPDSTVAARRSPPIRGNPPWSVSTTTLSVVVPVSRRPDRWRSVAICGSPARLRNEPNTSEHPVCQMDTTRPRSRRRGPSLRAHARRSLRKSAHLGPCASLLFDK
jgi:hypothetical protein